MLRSVLLFPGFPVPCYVSYRSDTRLGPATNVIDRPWRRRSFRLHLRLSAVKSYASLLALPSLLFNHISQLSFIPPLLIIFVLLWRLRLMSSLLSLSFMVSQLLVNYFCFRLWLLRLKVSWICNYKPYIYLCYVGLYNLSKLSNPGKALVRRHSARSRLAESQFALNRRNSSSFSSQCTPEQPHTSKHKHFRQKGKLIHLSTSLHHGYIGSKKQIAQTKHRP